MAISYKIMLRFTYWLKEVDQGTLLNDNDGKGGYFSGVEECLHGGHDLVKAASKSTQSHNHVNLKEIQNSSQLSQEAGFQGTIGRQESISMAFWPSHQSKNTRWEYRN